ncbi:MAG: hypothetical protein AMJ84_00155 [Acidithiobacillales bacterium SM23_46]|nr:MAG: hypothetical protein AMJ84_00155 [Acidithiobacillales bacterium SM23_46]KPL29032.1 MAG: hypothetical protein AMJ72_00295 [Acidithiobacillales bacterium SM1_46]
MPKEATAKKTPAKEAKEPEVTQEPAKEAAPEAPAKSAPVTQSRFGLQAEFNTPWRVNVELGTTPEETLDEKYWQHISQHFRPGDTIVVMPDDMSWKQVLHVVASGRNYTIVEQEEFYQYKSAMVASVDAPSEYDIEFAGSHYKWRVRLGDRVLKDGFETRPLAARWAANHQAATER